MSEIRKKHLNSRYSPCLCSRSYLLPTTFSRNLEKRLNIWQDLGALLRLSYMVPSPSNLSITQHVSESTPRTSSCVCQSLACTHDPVNVLRHMLPFRLPPKAAKYGSDGQTCGVDRLVSTGCRFHTTVLSIPPFFCFSKPGFRTARSSYNACTTSLPFQLDLPKIHISTSTRPSYWVSSSICTSVLLLVLPFPLEYVDPY